jgi:formate dehydrogenase subunit gamma
MNTPLSNIARVLLLTVGLATAGISFAQQGAQSPTPQKVESVNIMDVGRAPNATSQAAVEAGKNQPGNNAPIWRTVNTVYGAWLLTFVFCAIVAVFILKGSIKLHEPMSGKTIQRFTLLERITHWTMAFTFVALALTGILILWGKYFLLPLMGPGLYGPFLLACKNIHNFVGPAFTVSILVFFILFVRRNLPEQGDWEWVKGLGGLPANFFNPGEKMLFWVLLVILGSIVSASGWVLNMIVPFMQIEYFRGTMQIANIIHNVGSILMVAMALGHMYIGSIGMQGSLDGMRTGNCDETWAKEHHQRWYNKLGKG